MYRPDQRQLAITGITTAGVVKGTLHVPRTHLLVDALNRGHEMLPLTDVSVRDAPTRLAFFALRRSQCIAIIPPTDENLDDAAPRRAAMLQHAVVCLCAAGMMSGKLQVPKDVRVSDHLQGQTGFLVLTDCQVKLEAVGLQAQTVPQLLVYAPLVVGVTELPGA